MYLWWAGGSGAFTDPNFYLDPGSDQGPFGPPGPSDFVDYLILDGPFQRQFDRRRLYQRGHGV